MSIPLSTFHALSDHDLLREVIRLAAREHEATACLVASLAVLDQRRLYLAEGYSSIFAYCTEALHLSEGSAYKRITTARAAQRFPVILERLAAGDVTLTTIRLLAPHLTEANHVALLDEVRHCSTRAVEQVVARLQPRPDVPSTVRKLPPPTIRETAQPALAPATSAQMAPPVPASARDETSAFRRPAADAEAAETHHEQLASTPTSARPRGTVAPLAPARYKVSFTIDAETHAKLREAQDLLRHVVPSGDIAALFGRGLTLLLREAAKTKHAATEQPRAASSALAARSRHIPAAVKRRVWAREGGRCAFVSTSGQRCTERSFLEYHHCVPYAAGGEASVGNISLRCRAHNVHEAEQAFGRWRAPAVRERRPDDGTEAAGAQGHQVFSGLDTAHLRGLLAANPVSNWPRGEFAEAAHRPAAVSQRCRVRAP